MEREKYRINIQIKRGLGFAFTRHWIKKVITSVLNAEQVSVPFEIDCVITDNATIHKLNKTYRSMDNPTDVLSFSLLDVGSSRSVVFPEESGMDLHLGQIVISYEQAQDQARALCHDVEEELRLLLVHGILHLLGYDHEKSTDARKMRAREKAIIKRIIQTK